MFFISQVNFVKYGLAVITYYYLQSKQDISTYIKPLSNCNLMLFVVASELLKFVLNPLSGDYHVGPYLAYTYTKGTLLS